MENYHMFGTVNPPQMSSTRRRTTRVTTVPDQHEHHDHHEHTHEPATVAEVAEVVAPAVTEQTADDRVVEINLLREDAEAMRDTLRTLNTRLDTIDLRLAAIATHGDQNREL